MTLGHILRAACRAARSRCRPWVVPLALIVGASRVAAQDSRLTQPVGPLDAIVARVATYEAYDQNLLRNANVTAEPFFAVSGFYTGGDASIGFTHQAKRATISVGGLGAARYYPNLGSSVLDRYLVTGRLLARPARHSSLTLTGLAERRTAFAPGSLPEYARLDLPHLLTAGLGGPSFAQIPASEVGGRVALTEQLSTRSELLVDYLRSQISYARTDLTLRRQSGGARLRHQVTRSLAVNLGYGYTQLDAAQFGVSRIHTVDSAFDYAGDIAPHTQLAASAGLALIPRFRPAEQGRRDEFRATGRVSLRHQFERGWDGGVEYSRGVRFIEGSVNPLAYDRIEAGVARRLTNKLSAATTAGYAWGYIYNLAPSKSPYDLFSGEARVDYAMARRLGAYALYEQYGYNFVDQALIPLGVPGFLNRNAIQFGLTLLAGTVSP